MGGETKSGLSQNQYLLLTGEEAAICMGKLEGPANGPNWQIRLLEEDMMDEVVRHPEVKLMCITDSSPSYVGKVVRSRNDLVQLEVRPIAGAHSDKRQNLRVPTRFKSFLYPLSGRWKGRMGMEANDLSCGGIAFFCGGELEIGERLEIVVPITSEPVVLRGQILRQRPTERGDRIMYAAKFLDMCPDEEMLVREAVFSVQLSNRPRR